MELTYDFTVPVPPSEAWAVLLDLERVVPCLPGAALTSFDGESFVGTVRVKLGPVNLSYQGKGRFAARDEDAGRVVIEASGREARGAGTATTTATMTLRPADEGSTVVTVQADLSVTGKPAQFGRGMIAEVGGKLVGQFAECLARRLAESRPVEVQPAEGRPADGQPADGRPAVGRPAEDRPVGGRPAAEAGVSDGGGVAGGAPAAREPAAEPAASVAVPPAGSASTAETTASPPIDLLQVSAGPIVRRIAPYAIAFLLGVFVAWLFSRRG